MDFELAVKEILGNIPYFITGSRRFQTHTLLSDIDVCVFIAFRNEIYNKVKYPEPSSYNNGFKFYHNSLTINIIPLHQLDYVGWYYAAKLMAIAPNLKELNKAQIHGLHETFIGLMKSHFSHIKVTPNNYLELCK
jgi:hypothetical protein